MAVANREMNAPESEQKHKRGTKQTLIIDKRFFKDKRCL